MNWKVGLTRVYYVLWIAWSICWIYWSGLNLVHFGPSFEAIRAAEAAPASASFSSLATPGQNRERSFSLRSGVKAVLGSSVEVQPTGEPHWYFYPRPSTGQLLLLSMIGAVFPGMLLLAGRWVTAGFTRGDSE